MIKSLAIQPLLRRAIRRLDWRMVLAFCIGGLALQLAVMALPKSRAEAIRYRQLAVAVEADIRGLQTIATTNVAAPLTTNDALPSAQKATEVAAMLAMTLQETHITVESIDFAKPNAVSDKLDTGSPGDRLSDKPSGQLSDHLSDQTRDQSGSHRSYQDVALHLSGSYTDVASALAKVLKELPYVALMSVHMGKDGQQPGVVHCDANFRAYFSTNVARASVSRAPVQPDTADLAADPSGMRGDHPMGASAPNANQH